MWPKFLGRKAARTDPGRWLVLDVESSGLDASADRLLALAAVAVRHDGRQVWIELADSFEVVLQQPADGGPPDKSNILVHGIGVAAQGRGIDPATALDRFVAFVGGSPLLGFHVEFDRRLIDRATQGVLGTQVAPAPGWTLPTSRRCCSPGTARARWTTGWTPAASNARSATRRRPTRWPRPNCCCICGPGRAPKAWPTSGACRDWPRGDAGCPEPGSSRARSPRRPKSASGGRGPGPRRRPPR